MGKQIALGNLSLTGPASKSATWAQINAGDCEQDNATITFNSDGTGNFNCTVWTHHTHTGDTWHSDFAVKDAAGTVLFGFHLDGPNHMNDDGTHYPWNANFGFDAALWPIIASVVQSCDC
jgi:Family of unknown function (DUF6294)